MDMINYKRINYYNEVSKETIRNDEEVKDFMDLLYKSITKIDNFRISKNIVYKLTHPIKTIKNNSEYKRLKKIEKDFNNLVEYNVMYFNNDEFADLDEDLDVAAKYTKPNAVKKYIKSLNIK